jgi:hypothetical protein
MGFDLHQAFVANSVAFGGIHMDLSWRGIFKKLLFGPKADSGSAHLNDPLETRDLLRDRR